MQAPQLIIVDLGSQYTLLIARVLREQGVRSAVLSPEKAERWLSTSTPHGIIFSGGAASINDQDRMQVPASLLRADVPQLGICLGMHLLTQYYGGVVSSQHEQREYGHAAVSVDVPDDVLLQDCPTHMSVWASHGDSVTTVPSGFQVTIQSVYGIGGIADPARQCWGVQFHPEVTHTAEGAAILARFAFDVCGCEKDWQPSDIIRQLREEAVEAIGNHRAILGFSGGVDSTTMAAILAPALGDRLVGVAIDAGHLREGEEDEIREHAGAAGLTNLAYYDVRDRCLDAIGKTVNSEKKRKRFRSVYGTVLEEAAREHGADVLVQGTLAPDCIESGAVGESAVIKTHHNVGLDVAIPYSLHPLQHLFKYEVRALAEELGLPTSVSQREPFPGPGLFVRIIGGHLSARKLELVRWADARVRDIVAKHKEPRISQLVVALLCTRIVGIKGDERVYEYPIVVRAVETADFMTARGHVFSKAVREEIQQVLTQHPLIGRVWFDMEDKPPATTEFE